MKSVTNAVAMRRSCRAFLRHQPVDLGLVESLLHRAARAPSGGNVQPWLVHVVAGPVRDLICDTVRANIAKGQITDGAEYDVYPPNLTDPCAAFCALCRR